MGFGSKTERFGRHEAAGNSFPFEIRYFQFSKKRDAHGKGRRTNYRLISPQTINIMKKFKKTSVRLAMIGAIIGIMMTIVFSQSPNVLALIPAAGAVGGLIGTIIDKRKNRNLS